MADSTALRVRRSRAHKAGDHSLCRSCAVVRGEARPPQAVPSLPASPDLDLAENLDPLAEMRRLAARLALAHEAEPSNALLARELRMTLIELTPKDTGKAADADLTGLFGALQA